MHPALVSSTMVFNSCPEHQGYPLGERMRAHTHRKRRQDP
jgi:hypothetical protein